MKKTVIESLNPEIGDKIFIRSSGHKGAIYATRPTSYPWVLYDEIYIKLDNGARKRII